MNADPKIRTAQHSDVAAIKRCVDAAYQPYITRIGRTPRPMLDDYAEVVQLHKVFVVEEGSEVVGVLELIQTESNMLLKNVAVHPEHQGKGFGRCLLERAESEARHQGYTCIYLYTHKRMTENIELYERIGYVETENKIEDGYNRIYMRKVLS